MHDFDGKVAVITGGGSGIGAALARACAHEGMLVAVVDVNEQRAQDTVASLGTDRRVEAFAVDVRDPDAVEALAGAVFERLGGCHLLCNNAGISPLGAVQDYTFAEWQNTVAINLFGVVNGVNAFVPRLLAQGAEAHIVNTASAAALRYVPASALYNTTKFAVLGLTECLREELAPFSIGVSALCPGGVATNIGDTAAGSTGSQRSQDQMTDAITKLLAGVDGSHTAVIEPDQVAALVLEGVRENAPYIITHPGSRPAVVARAQAIDDAYAAQHERHPELP
jgi:NAD(P)-dependent dehydrogenase (short-subunit alcohol dehydrogenase family)